MVVEFATLEGGELDNHLNQLTTIQPPLEIAVHSRVHEFDPEPERACQIGDSVHFGVAVAGHLEFISLASRRIYRRREIIDRICDVVNRVS